VCSGVPSLAGRRGGLGAEPPVHHHSDSSRCFRKQYRSIYELDMNGAVVSVCTSVYQVWCSDLPQLDLEREDEAGRLRFPLVQLVFA
jgi:hypothetical protein